MKNLKSMITFAAISTFGNLANAQTAAPTEVIRICAKYFITAQNRECQLTEAKKLSPELASKLEDEFRKADADNAKAIELYVARRAETERVRRQKEAEERASIEKKRLEKESEDRAAAEKKRLEQEEIDAAKRAEFERVAAQIKAQNDALAAETEAREAQSERQFRALLSKKANPQVLYLRAGKFEREGESERAREVYEFIVDSFATSSWAVKANDRLLSIAHSSSSAPSQIQASKPGVPASPAAPPAPSVPIQPFPRLACVTWNVQWSTNPFFKNADIVKYQIQANFLEASSGQCEVKIRSQRRTSLLSDSPPFKDNESIVIECAKLISC
jgi:hypothetical protein